MNCYREGGEAMKYEIRRVRGHIEVYSKDGKFLFSADSELEAEKEMEEIEAA